MMTQFKSDMTGASTRRRRILWVDGVGGYLLVDRDEVTVGQAIAGSAADIGIVGDIRRQAGAIRRSGSDYLLQPLQATQLNGHAIERAQLLSHNDVIQFGERVRLRFTQPHSLSATARLDMIGLGKFQPHVDGVLLLADSCLIGSQTNCHVYCPQWDTDASTALTLVRRSQDWFFNAREELLVNGTPQKGLIAAQPGLRLCGANFSLSIE